LPSIEQVMPWPHQIFDAWQDHRRRREHEAAEREAAEQAVLEAVQDDGIDGLDDEDDDNRKKKKKKHKGKEKDKK
jgi:hypothetical protein